MVCDSINFWVRVPIPAKSIIVSMLRSWFQNQLIKVMVVLRTDLRLHVHQSTAAAEAAVPTCIYLHLILRRVYPLVSIRICPYLSVSIHIHFERICMLIGIRIYPYQILGSRIYSNLLVSVVQKINTRIYCIYFISLDTWKIRRTRCVPIFGKDIRVQWKSYFLKGWCLRV